MLGVFNFSFLKKGFIYALLERGKEGERKGEKHQCVVACHTPPTRDLACMCPDRELNQQPFGSPALNPLNHTSQVVCWES